MNVFSDNELYFYEDSREVQRGCTLDNQTDTNWCKVDDGCETCSMTGCNLNNARFAWCFVCSDKTKDDECAALPNINEHTYQCDFRPYPYSKRGCFTRYHGGN